MPVLARYLFREFPRAAAVCILGFLLLFLLIDFVDHAEKLLRHNASLREIGWYYLTRVPGMFVLISPGGRILAAQVVDAPSRSLRGFLYIELDGEFQPVRRIESRRARLLPDGAWELGEGGGRLLGGTPSIATFSLPTY